MKIGKEVKIGFLMVICLGLLFWGANFLKGTNILKKHREFYSIYERIDGLGPSNPVVINGYKVGQVEQIDLLQDNSGRLIVTFSVTKEDFRIPQNTKASIISSDLLGSKSISLELGDSPIDAKDLDTLASNIEESLSQSVNAQIAPLKNKAESLIGSIDSAITIVKSIFNTKAQADIGSSITNIKQSLDIFKKTMLDADAMVNENRVNAVRILENVESITKNLAENNEKLSATLSNMEAITDSLAGANLTQTVNNASFAMKQVAEVMDKINNGEGSMGKLLNNDTLYTNLESAANDLDLLLLDMRLNPERYVHFSIFGRKDKKKATN